MSGGNTTSQIGGGLLTAGLIAATVMSDGAAAPLLEEEMAAEGAGGALGTDAIMSGAAGTGGFTPAAGESANLFNVANAGNVGTNMMQAGAGINALNTVNNALSPQELQAWQQGQADSFIQNPNQYAPVASTGETPLVPANPTVAPNVPAAPTSAFTPEEIQAGEGIQGIGPKLADTQGYNIPANQPWYQQYWNNLTDTSGKGMNLTQKATLGGAGIATLLAMQKANAFKPNYMTPYQPVSAQSMGLGRTMSPGYAPARASQWGYAEGGNVASNIGPGSVATKGVAPADLTVQNNALPSQLQDLMSQYGISQQQASQGIQSLMTPKAGASFNEGGVAHLKEGSFIVPADVVSHFGNGSTDAGLKALGKHLGASPIMGHGDGMSDDIHTSIEGKQPARVANGEAIIHPEKVKQLGKGSTDAGAKKLYAMMNKVRKARTGTTKQGKQIQADKYLPA